MATDVLCKDGKVSFPAVGVLHYALYQKRWLLLKLA